MKDHKEKIGKAIIASNHFHMFMEILGISHKEPGTTWQQISEEFGRILKEGKEATEWQDELIEFALSEERFSTPPNKSKLSLGVLKETQKETNNHQSLKTKSEATKSA